VDWLIDGLVDWLQITKSSNRAISQQSPSHQITKSPDQWAACASAIVAQPVAQALIHWSPAYGKPLLK
jgi:hypothetical protein